MAHKKDLWFKEEIVVGFSANHKFCCGVVGDKTCSFQRLACKANRIGLSKMRGTEFWRGV